MSKVSNSNVSIGSTASSSETNAKFSDVAAATGTIDAGNVRYEGIDSTQLKDNYLIVRRGYVDNEVTDATAGVAYSMLRDGSFGSGAQAVNHVGSTADSTGLLLDFSSNPLTLKDGDLLRIWHSCHLYKHEYGNYIYTPGGGYVGGGTAYLCATYPVWSLTPSFAASGTTPTGFESFPGLSTNWVNTTLGSGHPTMIQQPEYGGSYNKRGYGLALYPLHGVKIGTSDMRVRYTGGSTLNYQHSGSDLKVYALRIFFLGPVYYQRYNDAGSDFLSFTTSNVATGALFNNAYISHGHVGFMQMRGGSV